MISKRASERVEEEEEGGGRLQSAAGRRTSGGQSLANLNHRPTETGLSLSQSGGPIMSRKGGGGDHKMAPG